MQRKSLLMKKRKKSILPLMLTENELEPSAIDASSKGMRLAQTIQLQLKLKMSITSIFQGIDIFLNNVSNTIFHRKRRRKPFMGQFT